MKTAHRIRILGREIQVRSNASTESVREVEAYVNGKLADVAASIPHADQQLVALLTLLNISEAYLALKRQDGQSVPFGDESVGRILQKIDKALE